MCPFEWEYIDSNKRRHKSKYQKRLPRRTLPLGRHSRRSLEATSSLTHVSWNWIEQTWVSFLWATTHSWLRNRFKFLWFSTSTSKHSFTCFGLRWSREKISERHLPMVQASPSWSKLVHIGPSWSKLVKIIVASNLNFPANNSQHTRSHLFCH